MTWGERITMQQLICRWLDESGHITTYPSKAKSTMITLTREHDRLYLEYIKKHAVRRYEPILIDELLRKNNEQASEV
jgi:hypothetical protein